MDSGDVKIEYEKDLRNLDTEQKLISSGSSRSPITKRCTNSCSLFSSHTLTFSLPLSLHDIKIQGVPW